MLLHAQPDVSFDAVEALQPVPRLVYGLLRSPVLTQAPGHHPDLHTALRLLWTALPPEELRRAVYPLLSSFTTPDVQVRLSGHHACACFVVVKQGNHWCRDAPARMVAYVLLYSASRMAAPILRFFAAGLPAAFAERSGTGDQRGADFLAGQLHAG